MSIIMNRNTSPKRPLTDKQLQDIIIHTPLHQYPEEELKRFKELYASYHSLNPEQIELANGSDEWLQKLMIQFGERGVLTIDPDFFMYQDYARQINRPFWQVDSNLDFEFNLADILNAIQEYKPSLLIISNPQNPTGLQFEASFLQELADAMEEIKGYFVIDEAYIEFGDGYPRPKNSNVIIIRTLSKIYGLAGLRIGIAIAEGETFNRLVAINHPYPINNLSLNVANALFANPDQLDEWVAYQKACQAELIKSFDIVKDLVIVKPTKSNFVFTYGEKARALGSYLIENGYIPRTYDAPNLSQVVRYSILDLAEYDRFREVLKTWRELND